jgi:hypothetical protein
MCFLVIHISAFALTGMHMLSAMTICCIFYLLVVSLGTKRSQSSVGKTLLAFLGVNPPALKVGSSEYAIMCMLVVKVLHYLFPVVM